MWESVFESVGDVNSVKKHEEVCLSWGCKEMWGEVLESVLRCGGRCVRLKDSGEWGKCGEK